MNNRSKNGFGGKRLMLFTRFMDTIVSFSYQSLFFIWFIFAVLVGTLYFILSGIPGHGSEQLEIMEPAARFWNSIYFSFITVTSIGYGDITPMGASKFIAVIQSVLALFVFAILVTKLVSNQQDIALKQIHKLVFEDVFHNIREGFHIVRKDFDQIILRVNLSQPLEQDDWENLATAYRQAQSFLRRVVDFYEPENRLYQIDSRREELLQEGLSRTLMRVKTLLHALESKHIPWISQNQCLEELREFLLLVNITIRFWQRHSPHQKHAAFTELLRLGQEIHLMIEAAVVAEKQRE